MTHQSERQVGYTAAGKPFGAIQFAPVRLFAPETLSPVKQTDHHEYMSCLMSANDAPPTPTNTTGPIATF